MQELSLFENRRFAIVTAPVIHRLIHDDIEGCMRIVREAYVAHDAGQTVNPSSSFLRIPDRPNARIMALPAHMRTAEPMSGIKWISSYPENVKRGLARASAVLVLNEGRSGYPVACLEGSVISAARTAASAALAAERLCERPKRVRCLGVVGAGHIARYVLNFLIGAQWEIESICIFDIEPAAAENLRDWLGKSLGDDVPAVCLPSAEAVISQSNLTVIATVATTPHVADVRVLESNPTILHLSLRDLGRDIILAANNVVDDAQHALTAATSLALAAESAGHTGFVSSSLADLLLERKRRSEERANIFSPFGLGMLDVAMGHWIYERAVQSGATTIIEDFHPR